MQPEVNQWKVQRAEVKQPLCLGGDLFTWQRRPAVSLRPGAGSQHPAPAWFFKKDLSLVLSNENMRRRRRPLWRQPLCMRGLSNISI